MIKLPDPQSCKRCGRRGRVVDSRMRDGYRLRRRQCGACLRRWSTYETLIDPRQLRERRKPIHNI